MEAAKSFFETHQLLLSKLLEAPFLLFVFLIIMCFFFRREIRSVLGKGDITISWGEGKSIKLHDISDHIDQEVDQLREQLHTLQELIQNQTDDFDTEQLMENLSSEERKNILEMMRDSLRHSQWRWRTLKRLAIISKVTENEALLILQSDPDIVIGHDKQNNKIIKFKHR